MSNRALQNGEWQITAEPQRKKRRKYKTPNLATEEHRISQKNTERVRGIL